ncbi:PREDICTED: spermatogenesis-associated protein 6 [Acanthisitta chloris]|uniref:spermatogenesis-associated protein 6 n=1 Tax=Acanthisitta chloris TaxID=57068 RepID=UPI0004F0D5E6|nr:PREDICTED: spermatogenesis-associated protein 6 [Acanthisitta chloris]
MSMFLPQITCPGVLLKDKEELYLSVYVFGQCKKTQRVPAVFPLFFQEKLVFEKTFANIVDPGDLVKLLEFDTAVLELIQLVPPVGKVLATYEENTRNFLFPDPKLTCGHHGVEREILMKRSSSFTGIAPKLRFSTSSLIAERLLSSGRSDIQDDLNWVHHSTPNRKPQAKFPKKKTLSAKKSKHSLATKHYAQATIASKSRSPSPYTKRRMCELSQEGRQRLAHLNLGPYEFRRETKKPPFVVQWAKSAREKDLDSSVVCNEDVISDLPNRLSHSAVNQSSLRERFSSLWPSPANGDEIHKRVKNILRTHRARQRLIFDGSNLSKGYLTKTRRESSHNAPFSMSELQSRSPVQQNASVHLDSGEYWSRHAAEYKGKPHRAIFEESLRKVYRNMYEKAAGNVSD